jgi:hypothetical protein
MNFSSSIMVGDVMLVFGSDGSWEWRELQAACCPAAKDSEWLKTLVDHEFAQHHHDRG